MRIVQTAPRAETGIGVPTKQPVERIERGEGKNDERAKALEMAVSSIEKHAVTSLFSKPRTDVRITSYRALNEIGTPHARRLLNQAVDDKDPAVKSAVKEMLGMR